MKNKKSLFLFVLVSILFAGVLTADGSPFVVLEENAKTKTWANSRSLNSKFYLEAAIELSMISASYCKGYNFKVNIFANDNELLNYTDFQDDYIYGTAIDAVTKKHYGFVWIDYYEGSDEKRNLVGWNQLSFLRLMDNRILCTMAINPATNKFTKPADITIKKGSQKKSYNDIKIDINGTTYTYFMTNDYDTLAYELKKSFCRKPVADDLKENHKLSTAVMKKMEELGCIWSITKLYNGDSIINFYAPEYGAYCVYASELK